MARKYILRRPPGFSVSRFFSFGGPNAAWRKDPASERQIQRIAFFTGKRISGLTKGSAGAIIDELNADTATLAEYEHWKEDGEPNMRRWKARRARCQSGSLVATVVAGLLRVLRIAGFTVAAFAILAAVAAILVSSLASRSGSGDPVNAPAVKEAARNEPTANTPKQEKAAIRMPPATPAPSTPTPPAVASFDRMAAQRRAVVAYPELGRAGSPMNREFVARVKTKPASFFSRPEWPTELAKEIQATRVSP